MPAIGWKPPGAKSKLIVRVSVWGKPHLHSVSCFHPHKKEYANLAEAREEAKRLGCDGIKLVFES